MTTVCSEIKRVFESPAYRSDLAELSTYAESIMQERPMVLLLSKYLHKQHRIELEQGYPCGKGHGKRDLVIDGTTVEFKFHYDWHIDSYLKTELGRFERDGQLWDAVQRKKIHRSWSVTPRVYKDVCEKRPDIFVWAICERNLRPVSNKAALDRICQSKEQLAYNGRKGYGSKEFLKSVGLLLEKLQGLRPFSIHDLALATNGHFPSTYHIKLCDFESRD